MAKQRAGSGRGKSPFRVWVEENQKVIWVVLLIIIAPLFAFTGPVTSFLGRGMQDRVQEEFYGKSIMQSEVQTAAARIAPALAMFQDTNFQAMMSDPGSPRPAPMFGPDSLLGGGNRDSGEMDYLRFFLYREKARREGLRVSDRELSDHIRDLWQWLEAFKRASEEVAARNATEKKDTKTKDMLERLQEREVHELARRKKKEFEELKAFGEETWPTYVQLYCRVQRSGAQPRLRDFEETLRDLYLIAKLENHVRQGIQITPEEVYEKYRSENKSRLFSWTEFHADEALKEKIAAGLKPEDVKAHYDSRRNDFLKPVSIRAAWLLLPKEHFRKEAEKVVTETDVRKHYDDFRNQYRKPTISSQEAAFSVRTKEENEKYTASLFKSFEEVKEEVRKETIDKRADTDMRAFSQQLRTRLFPPNTPPSTATAPTPSLLQGTAREFPFLVTETSGWGSTEDAEKVFGKGFSRQVTTWLNQAAAGARPGAPKPELNAPAMGVESDAGLLYYSKPELRTPMVPPLEDIQEEVRKSLVATRAVELIDKAAATAAADVDAGKKTLEQVAETGLEVEVGPAGSTEKLLVKGTPVRQTPRHLGRYDNVMIPKKKDADSKDGEKKEPADKPEDGSEDPQEEIHPSSRSMIEAVARISEKGKTAVTSDSEEDACYVVRLDDFVYPDASKFEERRPYLESQLRREKEGERLAVWRAEVQAEARGLNPVEGAPGTGEQVPTS